MIFYITLVAAQAPLGPAHLAQLLGYIEDSGRTLIAGPGWLSPHRAAEIAIEDRPSSDQVREMRAIFGNDKIDVFVTARENRRKKLVIADMDSTIVDGETLDELAAHAGLKDKIAAITARAMNGELDFHAALRERVAMLRGLPESTLQQTLEKGRLNPGAATFIQSMKNAGATCILVSGGFTFFTGAFAKQAGFDNHHGNILGIENGVLTGTVEDPILDKDSKLAFLEQYCAELGIALDEALTIGDGANDLPMLLAAGLGIGYRPKPLLQESLDNCIIHGDLTAALFAQGFHEVPASSIMQ